MGYIWPRARPLLLNENSRDHEKMYMTLIEPEKVEKPFKFYHSWVKEDGFNQIFKEVWLTKNIETPLFHIFQKLKLVKEAARSWSFDRGRPIDCIHRGEADLHSLLMKIQDDLDNTTLQQQLQEAK